MYIIFAFLLVNYIHRTDQVLCLLQWDNCLKEAGRRKYCGFYYLDITKAFHLVSQSMLAIKLYKCVYDRKTKNCVWKADCTSYLKRLSAAARRSADVLL